MSVSKQKGITTSNYTRQSLLENLEKEINKEKILKDTVEDEIRKNIKSMIERGLKLDEIEDHDWMYIFDNEFKEDEYNCPVCNVDIRLTDKFCHGCGVELKWEKEDNKEKKNNAATDALLTSVKNFFREFHDDNRYSGTKEDIYAKLKGTFRGYVPKDFPDSPESLYKLIVCSEDVLGKFKISFARAIFSDNSVKICLDDVTFDSKEQRTYVNYMAGRDVYPQEYLRSKYHYSPPGSKVEFVCLR
jgi:hypothetical protein